MKTTDRIYGFVIDKLKKHGELTFREIAEFVEKELLKEEYDEKQLQNCMQSLKRKNKVSRNLDKKYYLLECTSISEDEFEEIDDKEHRIDAKTASGYFKKKRLQLLKICTELDSYLENPLDRFEGNALVEVQKMYNLIKKVKSDVSSYK